MDEDDLRKLDYEKTLEYIKQLTDIRFKLLALLPIATGAALGLADPDKAPMSGLFLGLLGFFVTLGILFYDQCNTQIYEKEMHRARLLELKLKIPPTSNAEVIGGVVGGRPQNGPRRLFKKIKIWHDRGLAFIYSAVLAVWTYLVVASAIALLQVQCALVNTTIELFVPFAIAGVCWWQLHVLDTPSSELTELKEEIKKGS